MRRKTTTIYHPKTRAKSTVDARTVPGWERAGWTTTPPAKETADEPSSEAATAAEAPASEPTRRKAHKSPATAPDVTDAPASTTE